MTNQTLHKLLKQTFPGDWILPDQTIAKGEIATYYEHAPYLMIGEQRMAVWSINKPKMRRWVVMGVKVQVHCTSRRELFNLLTHIAAEHALAPVYCGKAPVEPPAWAEDAFNDSARLAYLWADQEATEARVTLAESETVMRLLGDYKP
jgi:hypothetical protein